MVLPFRTMTGAYRIRLPIWLVLANEDIHLMDLHGSLMYYHVSYFVL